MPNAASAKKPVFQDWHPADVVAAVRKAGWSLRRLSAVHELVQLNTALRQPWPRAERIIADAIGMRPQVIWPSRYDAQGRPKSGLRRVDRPGKKDSTRRLSGAPAGRT